MTRAPAAALAAVWLLATTFGPTAVDAPSDLPVYRGYADALRAGLVPYLDFELEYPPLALVPIGLGAALGTGETAYAWCFGALMLLAALVAQREAAALAGPRGRFVAWSLVALPVLLGAIVRTRFDAVPTALALAGLAAVATRRPAAGFALLALGTAVKLFPAILAAVALAWLLARGRRAQARRGAAAFAAVLAVVCLPFLVASPTGFWGQFAFHLERPVQIESTPASVLWALGGSEVTGAPARPDGFRSNGLDGGAAGAVAALFAVVQLAALAAAVVLAGRPGPDPAARRLVLGAFAAALAFVALGKVLSPQFLIWLAPLAAVAFAHGARAPALLVAVALPLTQLEFPVRYDDLLAGRTEVVLLVAARNAVLVAALALVLRRLAAPARSSPPAAAHRRSG